MAKLRSVNTKFWDDPYIGELEPMEKLLFLYLLTNPLTNIAGCYEISLRRIAFDTGIETAKVSEILTKFAQANKIIYRDGWLLIRNFIKNQSMNPKILKGIEETVKCCPIWIKDSLSIAYQSLSHLNSNSNTVSNETGEAPLGEKSVSQRIWTDGVDLLKSTGKPVSEIKSLLGKLAKQYTNELLAQSIAITQSKNPVNPHEFLIGTLKFQKNLLGGGLAAAPCFSSDALKNAEAEFLAQIGGNGNGNAAGFGS